MSSQLLQTYIDRASILSPGKQALTDGNSSLTHLELFEQANKLARCLISLGLKRGEHVVLYMSRSVQFIVAIMGVLKADGTYVPVQAETPPGRIQKIIADCKPRVIICDNASVGKILTAFPSFLPFVLIYLGTEPKISDRQNAISITSSQIQRYSADSLTYDNNEDDIACIHYTSGSTGTPKGVMITHRNIDEYIKWAVDRIGINDRDRILGTAPLHLDMSLFDVYCSLRTGATLCIASEKLTLFPRLLIDFAEAEKVTIWKGVSSLLMYLARTGAISEGRLPSLKKIIFSGEVLPTKYLIHWMNLFPDKIFYNAYGPTEATGISMYYRIEQIPESAEERIPLGKPCENTEILILDENRNPVPPGEPGELYIKGICVAKGYLNDTAKTNEVFFDNPSNPMRQDRIYKTGDFVRLRPDGNYEFLGRKDNQVKYMGYRIELSDIEQSLVSITGVRDAGVILAESITDNLPELVAYIDVDEHISISQVVSELKNRLPAYMIPKQIFKVERIPRSSSGKIDRRALLDHHARKTGRQ